VLRTHSVASSHRVVERGIFIPTGLASRWDVTGFKLLRFSWPFTRCYVATNVAYLTSAGLYIRSVGTKVARYAPNLKQSHLVWAKPDLRRASLMSEACYQTGVSFLQVPPRGTEFQILNAWCVRFLILPVRQVINQSSKASPYHGQLHMGLHGCLCWCMPYPPISRGLIIVRNGSRAGRGRT
jgi:hypothetical protein